MVGRGVSSQAPSPRALVRVPSEMRPQIRRGDPLNLSILAEEKKLTRIPSVTASDGKSAAPNPRPAPRAVGCTEHPLPGAARGGEGGGQVLLIEVQPVDGVRPVAAPGAPARVFPESGCLGMQPKAGGKLHLRLNTGRRPIVNKYSKGKLKRTLKREVKRA